MDISEVLSDTDAVLDAYYPGQFGATAIAGEWVDTLASTPQTCTNMVGLLPLFAIRYCQPSERRQVRLRSKCPMLPVCRDTFRFRKPVGKATVHLL
eukprot:COSAG02_NODE_594_length_19849_cov_323.373114_3_plen_96_part_00